MPFTSNPISLEVKYIGEGRVARWEDVYLEGKHMWLEGKPRYLIGIILVLILLIECMSSLKFITFYSIKMLDSKLNLFFAECKQKSDSLMKEINSLKRENIDLEKLVSTSEAETALLLSTKNKFQLQFEQANQINKAISNDAEVANQKVTKAKNDFCNITKAYQLQKTNISKAETELKERENQIMKGKKNRINDCKYNLKVFNEKIEHLRREIQRREEINAAARLTLLEKELKETHRVTSILDEQRNYFSKY